MALVMCLKTNFYVAVLSLPFSYLGVCMGYWGADFDLSTLTTRTWKNELLLSLRGMFIVLPLAIIFSPFHYYFLWLGVLAGALFTPCYLLGNIIRIKIPYIITSPTQWGEFLLGFCILGAVYA